MGTDSFCTNIDIKFGGLAEMIEWCQTNCNGDWTYYVMASAGQQAGSYQFNFKNQTDYVNFILWKK